MDERDHLLTLLQVHDLHTAPLSAIGQRARFQHHPMVAAVKCQLETSIVEYLDAQALAPGVEVSDAVALIRRIAAGGLVPAVYEWLATEATEEHLVAFLALEGGPDGGFDDLVAICQVGLGGQAKLEMARNYWDEMGRGRAGATHTELHQDLVTALAMPSIAREEQPTSGLLRSALGSLLVTNRGRQPELVGALGVIELQAGPRCRKVIQALERVGASAGALPFYREHASVDPRHGKDWLDHVVAPLASDPWWAQGMVRGARWRAVVNERFFADLAERFVPAGELRRSG